ncbi:GGDEF domain-containing protein [Aminipila luticellarii]|uniref:GGDEF domain-containing protein n=1 Tax=Aminipila luticellarii TaxID=2507160 RepID=A0A410PXX1_9FIRM|nr:GGDEF domain-containing protein [Aminipila luticellarii]QAT43690.1 GGDEF domain-containing protein [Aminipila luticellarii]
MAERIALDKLEQNLVFFNKMYDAVRLVDPVHKKVLEYRDRSMGKTSRICYDYWGNGGICDNCISVRAHCENKSYIKLEQDQDAIMLVTAIPIETDDTAAVLELFKNATDSMMIGTGNYNDGKEMRHIIYDMNNMIIRDHLTSLYNRRFVDDRLPVDIVKATVAEQPLSTIFIDIDNMKTINDTYGHITGDLVLKQVAAAVQNSIRADLDWAARYGGDEFIVCLNNMEEDEVLRIAERIRSNISSIEVPIQNEKIRITASLGVQTMSQSSFTAEEMIRRADEKMYQEKKDGKN